MEVTDIGRAWRKSSFSGGANGSCVEVGNDARGVVLVRDTTNRDGGTLAFPAEAWRNLLADVRGDSIG